MKNKKGFTLIELLVVIAIIGLLSTLAVVSLNNARSKARDARRVSDIKTIQTAVELYKADTNDTIFVTPAAAGGAWASVGSASLVNYLPGGMPTDPTNSGSQIYTLCTDTADTDENYLIFSTLENPPSSYGSTGLLPGSWAAANCINSLDLKVVPAGTCGAANLFCLGDTSM